MFGSCKSISGKYSIFRKGKCFHVFGCISKTFPKTIFWCLEKKKEKTNLEKHRQNPEKKKSSMIDARLASSMRGEIAIDSTDWRSTGACDRRGLELGVRRQSLDWTGLELAFLSRAHSHSLSHSLSLFGIHLK